MSSPSIIPLAEAAGRLGVNKETVKRWADRGKLRRVYISGQSYYREEDINKLVHLIRTYFKLGGHHIQFNIADTQTLRQAQKNPAEYRDLLVRVAGYSDYFVDLDPSVQQEIIDRTAHASF